MKRTDIRSVKVQVGFLDNPRARFGMMLALLGVTFLMGGSSRADILSLSILRPVAIVILAFGLQQASADDLARVRVPLALLAALAVLMVVQLIPMPPTMWSALPDRGVINQIGELLGFGSHLWRPLSLTPSRTLNSLFSLTVPAAAIVMYSIQIPQHRRKICIAILGLAVLSSVWGFLQLGCGENCVLYTYSISNSNSPIGAFANRNHQAVFLACSLLVAAWALRSINAKDRLATTYGFGVCASGLMLLPGILLSGSRAGLVICAISIVGSLYIIRHAPVLATRYPLPRHRFVTGKQILAVIAVGALIITAIAGYGSAASGVARLAQTESIDEIRLKILPVILDMTKHNFLVGSGFGSFAQLYKFYEPSALLGQKYVNQAHDDWIQIVLEGGIPALAILVVFIGWVLTRTWASFRMESTVGRDERLMAAGIVMLYGIASFVDYPLRVPINMVFFAISAAVLARPTASLRSLRS